MSRGKIHPHNDPARRCMPPEEWPAEDRSLWQAAQEPGDILEPGGIAAGWGAHTRRAAVSGYGRYLTWLLMTGQLEPEADPRTRLTRSRVAAFVVALEAINAPQTVHGRVGELELFVRATMPDVDRGFLRDFRSRLWARMKASRKAPKIRHVTELVELGLRLMADAEEGRGLVCRRRATQYRDGLIIALLALRPLRLGNFTGLVIGRHLVRRDKGWWLLIPAAAVKNRHPIEVPFPALLESCLERYLAHYRLVLAASRGRWHADPGQRLWISGDGSALKDAQLHLRVVGHTRRVFGIATNPHLFRDCAATTIAMDDPAHVRIAAQILGHARFATTERHYRLSRSAEAARSYQAMVHGFRQRAHE